MLCNTEADLPSAPALRQAESGDQPLDKLLNELWRHQALRSGLDWQTYHHELVKLQRELVKLQDWVVHKKLKVLVIFEGRDTAGKGGTIRRMTQRLDPRMCRVVALPAPSEREKTEWYFKRYVAHLPAGGEIVLFDRSWYNRAGVERVMGFCSNDEYEEFLRCVPEFERMLTRSGILMIKYWLSITFEEQHFRLQQRIKDPLKRWKLSAMDIESRQRWQQYTFAKEAMMTRTHTPNAPWWVVDANDKRRARLNCIRHLLEQIPYEDVPRETVMLPDLPYQPHQGHAKPADAMQVPDHY
jgi:polyphosphate kinase 2